MLIFNPEHDLCLANGDVNFVAPESAMKFGVDCGKIADFMRIEKVQDSDTKEYKSSSVSSNQNSNPSFSQSLCSEAIAESDCNPKLSTNPSLTPNSNCITDEKIIPWGWNHAIRNKLIKSGVAQTSLPSVREIENIRRLSHRRYAIKAKDFILNNIDPLSYPFISRNKSFELKSMEEVYEYCSKTQRIVLKAPWSGSGKGLRWIKGCNISENDKSKSLSQSLPNGNKSSDIPDSNKGLCLSDSDKGWCKNILEKQASIIAEKEEDVICNFAMLFNIEEKVSFEGYSIFKTKNGVYKSNLLASDKMMLKILCSYVPYNHIDIVRSHITSFLETEYSNYYSGPIGVDMFICRSEDGPKINPCVEINVRMTMGMISKNVYNSLFATESYKKDIDTNGRYELVTLYNKKPSILREKLKTAHKILTEIKDDSQYALAVYNMNNYSINM